MGIKSAEEMHTDPKRSCRNNRGHRGIRAIAYKLVHQQGRYQHRGLSCSLSRHFGGYCSDQAVKKKSMSAVLSIHPYIKKNVQNLVQSLMEC